MPMREREEVQEMPRGGAIGAFPTLDPPSDKDLSLGAREGKRHAASAAHFAAIREMLWRGAAHLRGEKRL